MLAAGDDPGRASLGLRLAALCAEEAERRGVRARLDTAFALERAAMGGASFDPDDTEGPAIVHELERHVRALLRDVVCGYLSGDLRSVADDILLASSDPIEIHARDTRDEPAPDPGWMQPDLLDEPPPLAEERETGPAEPDPDRGRVVSRARRIDGPGTAADPRSSAWRLAAQAGPRTQRTHPVEELTIADRPLAAAVAEDEPASRIASLDAPEPEGVEHGFSAGVTPSADWGDDEDCWSAPV